MDNQRCRDLYGQGKTYREISDILGENYETVRSCITRTPNYRKLRNGGAVPEAPTEPQSDIEASICMALKKPNGLDKEQFCEQHKMDARILAANAFYKRFILSIIPVRCKTIHSHPPRAGFLMRGNAAIPVLFPFGHSVLAIAN